MNDRAYSVTIATVKLYNQHQYNLLSKLCVMLFAIDIGFNFTVWCWVVGCFGVFIMILAQKAIKKINSNTKINGGVAIFQFQQR